MTYLIRISCALASLAVLGISLSAMADDTKNPDTSGIKVHIDKPIKTASVYKLGEDVIVLVGVDVPEGHKLPLLVMATMSSQKGVIWIRQVILEHTRNNTTTYRLEAPIADKPGDYELFVTAIFKERLDKSTRSKLKTTKVQSPIVTIHLVN